MGCIFNYDTKEFDFISKDNVEFKFSLRCRTVIKGDSGSGKTYLVELIQDRQRAERENDEESTMPNVTVITNKEAVDTIRKVKRHLIIIDRADYILNEDAVKYINSDCNNIYLIYSRKQIGLEISPNYVGKLKRIGNIITLEYEYSIGGWF